MKKVVVAGVSVLAAGALASCGSSDAGAKGGSVQIGVILELSGPFAPFGASARTGVQMAADELSKAEGRKVVLHVCDAKSDPAVARNCFNDLTRKYDLQGIVGPIGTASVTAIAPLLERQDLTMFNLSGSFGGETQNHIGNMFAVHASNEQGTAAVWAWAQAQGYTRGFLISQADDTGQGSRNFVSQDEFAKDRGDVELVGQTQIAQTATTAAPVVAKIPKDVDFIFSATAGSVSALVATAAQQAGIKAPVVISFGNSIPALSVALGKVVPDNAVYAPAYCLTGVVAGGIDDTYGCTKQVKPFIEEFKSQSEGATPDSFASTAYDAVKLVTRAIEATDGSAPAVQKWLEGAGPITGVTGTFEFGPEHHRGLSKSNLFMAVEAGGQWKVSSLDGLGK